MHSTSLIPAGAQVFNTYADPPNADLLRRYGHVEDVNENDECEIGLADVVHVFSDSSETDPGTGRMSREEAEERAEWLLDCEDGEEYVLFLLFFSFFFGQN